MKNFSTALIFLTTFLSFAVSHLSYSRENSKDLKKTPADYVNPFIGTSNFGATHPGAQYPHGMASVVPFNVAHRKNKGNLFEKDSEWNSRPYVRENTFLTGFSHVNLSGVGCPDLGSILLMPTVGKLNVDSTQYGTTYRDEVSLPGSYSVSLDNGVNVDTTSTLRTGLSRYIFPEGESNVLLNLGLGLTNETGAAIKIVSNTQIEGYKTIGTFCYNSEDVRPVYFVAKLSKPAKNFGTFKKMPTYKGVEAEWVKHNDAYKTYPGYRQEMAGDNIGAYFTFDTNANEAVQVKVGISYVSIENARQNLITEQPKFAFEKTKEDAKKKWNELLGRIELSGTDENKTLFYTALYHVLIHPNIIQDVNGDYPLMGQQGVGNSKGKNRYTVFSLWDTYRNVHPLLSLVYPELQSEMVATMVGMAKESGWLPKWELLGMETDVMVGDPALVVIADTYLRGIRDFDVDAAYKAMKKNAGEYGVENSVRPFIDDYLSLGYVPVDNEDKWEGRWPSSLEYAIADWNIAQLAMALNKKKDAKKYLKRSQGYRHYFDKETGMLRPKYRDGRWYTPFDPEAGKNFEPVVGFVEGTAWNYRFYAPHDMPGLIDLLGGPEKLSMSYPCASIQINYDMANEPDITYPFLFKYVSGEEWRSQQKVLEINWQAFYQYAGGLPGNDDTGTLSAWLAFSMIGLYPVVPGDMDYALVKPSFDEVKIKLNPVYYTGKEFVIRTKAATSDDLYIRKITINGERLHVIFIDHKDVVKGGLLELLLAPQAEFGNVKDES